MLQIEQFEEVTTSTYSLSIPITKLNGLEGKLNVEGRYSSSDRERVHLFIERDFDLFLSVSLNKRELDDLISCLTLLRGKLDEYNKHRV